MTAIAVHHTETSTGPWDGPANEAKLKNDQDLAFYRRMYAWRDPDGDESAKSTYKFPHHEVDGDGNPGSANVKGCQTAIGILNGARGGADIPDGDREEVYRHVAAHLDDADVEPAELRSRKETRVIINEMGIERRFVPQAELRVIDDDGGRMHIRGYAAVFDEWSKDLGGFREQVASGAFNKTIQEADVRSLWNHDPNHVLGRSGSGTLSLFVDRRGLGYDVIPPDAQWARDLVMSIRRGDVTGSSFGFRTVRDDWLNEEGSVSRRLLEVELYDVGPVTWPAYPQTSAEARAKAMEMVNTSEPPEDGHSDDGDADPDDSARARLDVRRRELDLLEIEIT